MHQPDTIFAPATAPMKSGVAVLRVSGPRAHSVCALLGAPLPAPRVASLLALKHPATGQLIDHALCLRFNAPHSFTGDDVLELHTHGSRAVMASLLALLSAQAGFRIAEAGEFSRRAFEHGKMDLTQAEGLADLIDAETEAQATQARRQMQGEIGRRYDTLRHRIIKALALLEAYIDFPDEDIPPQVLSDMTEELRLLREEIAGLLADGKRGERLRVGIDIVILGPPNAGKSSLLNAIAKRDVAIVSAHAGTTRDLLEVHLDMGGYPVTLIDTAGVREAMSDIEGEGIRRALARAAQAELKLMLFDVNTLPESYKEILALEDENTLRIWTKCDTVRHCEEATGRRGNPENSTAGLLRHSPRNDDGLHISTITGEGVAELLAHLQSLIEARYASVGHSLITRARHRNALETCLAHLERVRPDAPLEITGEELRASAQALAKITGAVSVDDVLDLVFSSFCIGK